ncbi:MAG TPA: EAL domain-containing protein, partial [Steroidobacteraceae bacterium]
MPDKLEKAVAEISAKESTRIAALRSYGILDTPPEKVFDALAQLAASISGTPTALISFVDGQRQWFKARVGMSVHETPRDISFCTHAIGYDDLFIVPDAARDERFARNPLVTQNPRIRFYAGVPLITLEGQALGTLCVIDYVPRELTPEQQQALRDLSRYVMAQLDLRRRLAQFTRDNPVRQKTVASVRRALDENQFALYYQPTVDARNGHIAGLEAVLRWQCPERGLIGPKGFLPMLEDSGLIVEVGAWMLHQAARDYRDWLANGVTAPRIAVNVSS